MLNRDHIYLNVNSAHTWLSKACTSWRPLGLKYLWNKPATTVSMLCILWGNLLALYPKQGHGWRATRCGHWQTVHEEILQAWTVHTAWHQYQMVHSLTPTLSKHTEKPVLKVQKSKWHLNGYLVHFFMTFWVVAVKPNYSIEPLCSDLTLWFKVVFLKHSWMFSLYTLHRFGIWIGDNSQSQPKSSKSTQFLYCETA